ncbi:MAG TPA: AI-2E family transporter [Candidatus Paceibacterota bacterium]|jgi:predicted PurR-regulated permease PerM|nr:AI-2E family transporter [Candidatus Paceibacterota bacterium]
MNESRSIRISTDTIIRAILLIFLAVILYSLRDTLLLVIVSIVIASFVEAGVRMFKGWGVSRSLSVPIIFLVVISALLALFFAFVPVVVRELSGVLTLILQYLPSAPVNSQSVGGVTQFINNISHHYSLTEILSSVKTSSTALTQGATSIIGSTFGSLIDIALVCVMSFYLSIQERGIDNFLRILTPVKHEHYVVNLWNRTQHKIGLWFKGQLLLGLIMGAITIVVLTLLGVQYSFLVGLVTGIAELIPFGIIFAAIPAILFAVIDGGVILGVKVLIFYIVAHELEGYVLSPVVAHRTVGIPPLVVLLSFLIGISIAGFWGALIAIPVAVFALEYIGDVEKQKLVPITVNHPDNK